MRTEARSTILSLAALAVLSTAACAGSGTSDPGTAPPPFPVGKGIQQNLSLTSLQGGGWTVCYRDTYTGGAPIFTILAGCTGKYMMLACRADGTTDALALAAADQRSVVTTPDATSNHHVANGVGWYFNDMLSWGFFPASETVNLDPCDFDTGTQTMKDQRLCWHAVEGVISPGYRCGNNDLSTSSIWQRLVLVHP
jgi:hypothetical protein